MATPRYVVKKVGDNYVTQRVPEEPGERSFYLAAGGALVLYGLFKRGLTGAAAALAGAGMLYYAATDDNPLSYLAAPRQTRAPSGNPDDAPTYAHEEMAGRAGQQPADRVDEQSMESFPASDAPSHSGGAT